MKAGTLLLRMGCVKSPQKRDIKRAIAIARALDKG